VKADNVIMSSQGDVKLADFGIAKSLMSAGRLTALTDLAGTLKFMAPEVCAGTNYHTQADMWSFGIMAMELAMGHVCLDEKVGQKKLQKRIAEGPPPTLSDYKASTSNFSSGFKALVAGCLKMDPHKRLTASQALKLKFFKKAKNRRTLIDLMNLQPLQETQFRTKRGMNRFMSSAEDPGNSSSPLSQHVRTTSTASSISGEQKLSTAVEQRFQNLWVSPPPAQTTVRPASETVTAAESQKTSPVMVPAAVPLTKKDVSSASHVSIATRLILCSCEHYWLSRQYVQSFFQ
jgi:serine/threonine protein kinase